MFSFIRYLLHRYLNSNWGRRDSRAKKRWKIVLFCFFFPLLHLKKALWGKRCEKILNPLLNCFSLVLAATLLGFNAVFCGKSCEKLNCFLSYIEPNTPLVTNELFIRYKSWWEHLFTLGLFPAISLVYFNLRIYWKIRRGKLSAKWAICLAEETVCCMHTDIFLEMCTALIGRCRKVWELSAKSAIYLAQEQFGARS